MDIKQWSNEVRLETFHHYMAAKTWRQQSAWLVADLHRKYGDDYLTGQHPLSDFRYPNVRDAIVEAERVSMITTGHGLNAKKRFQLAVFVGHISDAVAHLTFVENSIGRREGKDLIQYLDNWRTAEIHLMDEILDAIAQRVTDKSPWGVAS
jgi:hypothetical protein|tara:strand:+ start:213 stop:665 length:453 start_codon:yes stop_codon:yes gene_type:complete